MSEETIPQTEQPGSSPEPADAEVEGAAPQPQQVAPKKRRRRWPWVLGGLGVLVGLFLFFLGSVTLLDYTESTAFCSLCHVMKPEHTAYMNSPHSRVELRHVPRRSGRDAGRPGQAGSRPLPVGLPD